MAEIEKSCLRGKLKDFQYYTIYLAYCQDLLDTAYNVWYDPSLLQTMKNLLLSALFFTAYVLFFVPVASADVACQPIYGGGQTCVQTGNILINKTVADPVTGAFVNNLGVNDSKFQPDQTVTFQLTVSNAGQGVFSQVSVQDIFPQFIDFVSGPGNFDSNSKNLTFTLSNLNPNESRTITVTGKVTSLANLPSGQSVTCVVNQAIATADNQTSQDNSQFCIQMATVTPTTVSSTTKGGLKVFPATPVTTAPSTGPEMLPLLALIPSGLLGAFLRKKTVK